MIKRPCTTPMCANYAVDGDSKCIEHKRAATRERFSKIKHNSLYNTKAWQVLRAKHKRVNPFCPCGAKGTDVDHKIKHNNDRAKFFDENNLQTLCKKCHSIKTLKGE